MVYNDDKSVISKQAQVLFDIFKTQCKLFLPPQVRLPLLVTMYVV